ncbi:membrane protein [Paenibacillus sp. J31TS4]|uniref:DMT family transporter n=1 Tax=Paenibacillus sp. J31TS4 TaxID=2807195 RepID=UPI001B2060F9|nr:DMT family transporter [Paenibacillus sp. J31TS4]GIP37181.1 membrane protein [Paenibacillus sp. J31TS4]
MKKTYLADPVLLFVTFIWGIMFVFMKEAVDIMPPFSHLAIRFLLGAAFMLAVALIAYRSEVRFSAAEWRIGFVLGCLLFVGFGFQTMGLRLTTVAKTGFITGLSVVIVPLLERYWLRSRLSRMTAAGVAVAAAGLFLLSADSLTGVQTGDTLVFVGALGFACHIVVTGSYAKGADSNALVVVQLLTVSVLSAFVSFVREDWLHAYSPSVLLQWPVLKAVLIGSVLATAFAYWAQTYFQRFTTPTRTAVIFAAEPIFAAGAAFLLSGERLGGQALTGCTLMMIGILLTQYKRS